MPIWEVRESQADYRLFDTPLKYTPAYGSPISLDLAYQTWLPTDYGYFPRNDANPLFGPQWHCAWSSDIGINELVYAGGWVYRTSWNYRGGRLVYSFNSDPDLSDPHYEDGSRLEILRDGSNNVVGGKVHRADGTVLEYSEAYSATRFLLTSINDPQANSLTFSYDGYGRLDEITTATGETVSFVFGDLDGDQDESNNRVVTQVNAPGNYSATFNYELHDDGAGSTVDWYLTNIVDTAGISTTFAYEQEEVIIAYDQTNTFWRLTSMTTPYGATQFEYLGELVAWGGGYTWVKMTDYGVTLLITEPNGGQHLYVQADQAPVTPPLPASFSQSVIPTGLPLDTLDTNRTNRNTFYWGPLQLAGIGNTDVESWDWDEFKRARIRHWLAHHDDWDVGHLHLSDTLSWEQSPSPDGSTEKARLLFMTTPAKIQVSLARPEPEPSCPRSSRACCPTARRGINISSTTRWPSRRYWWKPTPNPTATSARVRMCSITRPTTLTGSCTSGQKASRSSAIILAMLTTRWTPATTR